MEKSNRHSRTLLSLAVTAFVCFGLAGIYTANAADDPANEWKKWQTKYNQQMASKQPDKKDMWMNKELVEKSIVIDDAKLPNHEKRGKVKESCLTCHDGIEQMSAFHPIETYGCTICHGSGKPDSLIKAEAHGDMIAARSMKGARNPANLRILEKSCGLGGCHYGHEQEDMNHVYRVRRTVMGLQSGISGALRYQYCAQDSKFSKYWVRLQFSIFSHIDIGKLK